MRNIEIVHGDITLLNVEAVVNAANPSLLGGGGVDGAIHLAAGKELLEACKAIGGCPTSQARITPGFNLPSQWVIHTVGPVWQGGKKQEPLKLEQAYQNSCTLALKYNINSIAFPSISTGVYGYPVEKAANIALDVMISNSASFEKIIACCYSKFDYTLYSNILNSKRNERS